MPAVGALDLEHERRELDFGIHVLEECVEIAPPEGLVRAAHHVDVGLRHRGYSGSVSG